MLQIHVALSLIGIVSGFVVLYGLLIGRSLGGWTALFLATTILTSITGFPLAPFGFDPPRAVGVISLVLLALAVAALYMFRLAGAWRWVYVGGAIAALYLNVFVAVVQAFQKLPFLQPLAPDAIGAAISDRAGRRAGDLHRARHSGGDQVSPRARGQGIGTAPVGRRQQVASLY